MADSLIAERIVIGSLLNHSEWLIDVPNLKINFFENEAHRAIFLSIQNMFNQKGITIDSLNVYANCCKNIAIKELLESNGGLEYLLTMEKITSKYEVEDFKDKVKLLETLSYKKKSIMIYSKMIDKLNNDEEMEITDISNLVREKQSSLDMEFTTSSELNFFGNKINDVWQEIQNNAKDGVVGIESKFDLVNKYFTYRKGELVVVGGRPKGGKTVFGINEAYNLAVNKNIPVLYIDTEMQDTTFLARMLAIDTQLPINEIEKMSYKDSEIKKARVEQALERISNAPLIHEYYYDYDKEHIRKVIALAKIKYNIEFVVFDYIKIKEVSNNGVQEHNELGNWTIFLKNLAGEFQIPILSMAQMSQYDIRLADSDKINRYASTICYLLKYPPETIRQLDGCCETTSNGLEINDIPENYLFVDYNRNGAMMEDTSKGININFDRPRATMTLSSVQFPEIEYVDN